MASDRLEPGRNYVWDMEIGEYRDVFLHDFTQDTVVDFMYYHCDEMYTGIHSLRRTGDSSWEIVVPIECERVYECLEEACTAIAGHCDFLLHYDLFRQHGNEPEITILIDQDMNLADAYNYAIDKEMLVVDYADSIQHHRLSRLANGMVLDRLPVYSRAMKNVELELTNFLTDDSDNDKKIIEICSRVKGVESIQEKVYRKGICQFEVFDRFDDIAGMRCTCEFLSDVYDALEYIKQNPLFHVHSIEDKIATPSREGYRGIHVIVTTDVYYHGSIYKDIKVEIQLRTAFQNAWSMKTHQLTYKQEAVPTEIMDVMRSMSDALKAADDAAQSIREKLRIGGIAE